VNVHWTPEALSDRDDIYEHIAADSPSAAERMDVMFCNAADRLADHPYMGRRGELPGTRELFPHKNYRLVYAVDEDQDTIRILTLVHGARQWPPTSS